MRSKYAFFCDAATIDNSGKTNALGMFTVITSTKFPFVMHRVIFVLGLEANQDNIGKYKFRFRFGDSNGELIVPELVAEADFTSQMTDRTILLELNNLTFPATGNYIMDVTMDNQLIASEVLRVKEQENTIMN